MVWVKSFLLLLFGFFYIFNPYNFTAINPIHLLFVFSLLYFVFFEHNISEMISLKVLLNYFLMVLTLFFYLLFLYIFIELDAVLNKVYVFFVTFLEVPICSLFINAFLVRNRLYDFSIYKYIHYIILIQIGFVVASFLNDDLRKWIILTSKIDNFETISNQFGLLRTYGLGSGLTYSLPMLVGLSSVITFHLLISSKVVVEKIYWILFFLLSCVTVLLNAQTGMLPILIYLFLSFVVAFFNVKTFTRLLCLVFCTYIFYVVSDYFFLSLYSDVFKRTLMRLDDVVLLLNGQTSGVFADLRDMHFLPKDEMGILFGSGLDTLGNGSDVGYIRDLHMYGVFGIVTVMPILTVVCYYAFVSIKNEFGTLISLSLFLSIPFFYAKGMLFINNDVVNTMFLLVVSYFFSRKRRHYVE
ncbi:hypothetical protein ACRN9V_10260 [Shewanella baltica]|uniref:hypothetical protein n=1 Tax=Shewanella baltica TaxID=62322 RepID=UPI003D7AB58C